MFDRTVLPSCVPNCHECSLFRLMLTRTVPIRYDGCGLSPFRSMGYPNDTSVSSCHYEPLLLCRCYADIRQRLDYPARFNCSSTTRRMLVTVFSTELRGTRCIVEYGRLQSTCSFPECWKASRSGVLELRTSEMTEEARIRSAPPPT